MENNSELNLARQIVEKTGTSLFLTGKAGTGKTTFLHSLRDTSMKRMVVLAPTGVAAITAAAEPAQAFRGRAAPSNWRPQAACACGDAR